MLLELWLIVFSGVCPFRSVKPSYSVRRHRRALSYKYRNLAVRPVSNYIPVHRITFPFIELHSQLRTAGHYEPALGGPSATASIEHNPDPDSLLQLS